MTTAPSEVAAGEASGTWAPFGELVGGEAPGIGWSWGTVVTWVTSEEPAAGAGAASSRLSSEKRTIGAPATRASAAMTANRPIAGTAIRFQRLPTRTPLRHPVAAS
jgi:hypothetical protein